MSRLSYLTSALALLALGAGAIGFAATGEGVEPEAPAASTHRAAAPVQPRRPADRSIEVRPGESLAAALLAAGVAGLDSALAQQAGGELGGSMQLWLGGRVGVKARSLDRLELHAGPGRRIVIEREGDDFVRRDLVERFDQTPVRLRLAGGAGLAADLVEAGLPRDLRFAVLDRLRGEQVVAIDLIVAHEAGASGSHYGAPLYLGLNRADGSIRRWIGEDGTLRPLGSEDAAPAAMLRPLPGPVTSSPGLRFHPILRYLRWHRGTDFASPAGTPVQAALEGRVIEAGWSGGYGRTVRIAHPDGSRTLYAHLSEIDVAPGQSVSRGAVIGKVGATGLATGPHLHFEWQRGGDLLQPRFGIAAAASAQPAQRKALQALLSAPYRLPRERRS